MIEPKLSEEIERALTAWQHAEIDMACHVDGDGSETEFQRLRDDTDQKLKLFRRLIAGERIKGQWIAHKRHVEVHASCEFCSQAAGHMRGALDKLGLK